MTTTDKIYILAGLLRIGCKDGLREVVVEELYKYVNKLMAEEFCGHTDTEENKENIRPVQWTNNN